VQSFPDWFVFPEARTHAFRLIGNAVPPLVAEAVGCAIRNFLAPEPTSTNARPSAVRPAAAHDVPTPPARQEFALPADRSEAFRWLEPFANPQTDRRTLRAMPTGEFLRAWHALLWLFPELHPDNAIEHGDERHEDPASASDVALLGRERFTRSGWPVMLESFGREAWRRFEAGEFPVDAFYFVDAQRAGLVARIIAAPQPSTASPLPTPTSAGPRPAFPMRTEEALKRTAQKSDRSV
jgi:DNA (cytosine-5)-methyltransferase 1